MQKPSIIIAIVLAVIAFAAGALIFQAPQPVEDPTPAEPPPEVIAAAAPPEIVQFPKFTLKDMGRNDRDFSEFDGRHRLLNFWATWCAPCRREIPVLKTFQAEQPDDGILVIGIAVDVFEDVLTYAEKAEFNYPILIGEEDAMAVAELSGISFIALPFTMIVTRNGEFLSAYMGELHRPQLDQIADVLARLDSGDLDAVAARHTLDALIK